MSITETCIKNPVLTVMMIAAMVVFGAISYTGIGLDNLPEINPPVATITCAYPGADPETIEKEVSQRIEDAVSQVAGIKTLRSMSLNNVSITTIEFEMELNAAQAVQEVRDKVSTILSDLPEDAKTPVVARMDPDSWPILNLTVSGPAAIGELTKFARERVRDPLQALSGVGSADIVGGQEREIQIAIDPQKLRAHGLAVTDVIGALKAGNIDYPGGTLRAAGREQTVKLMGRFASIEAIRATKIMEVAGQPIFVGDVARVEDSVEERQTAASVNDRSAVMLQVRKQSGANTLAVGDKVKAQLEELKKTFPPGFDVVVSTDATRFIRESFESVRFDLFFGAVLAVLIVFLFLRNTRSTLIAAVAIPSSLLGTLVFMRAFGFTFNMITLVALSLSIGMLIDDAIVILENIYRHIELGQKPFKAAASGTKEIALAVMATTFTIVAVFVPVAFMKGMIGRLFYQFGLTVAFAVLLSLFVSFTLTPMLCSRYLKPIDETHTNVIFRWSGRLLDALDGLYRRVIAWALGHRALTIAIALLVFCVGMFGARFLEFTLTPTPDTSQIDITVKMPQGTALEKTESYSRAIAAKVREHKEVLETITSVGADQQKRQYQASITVKTSEKEDRREKINEIIDELRLSLAPFKDATIFLAPKGLFDSGMEGTRADQVQYDFRGKDLLQIDQYTQTLMEDLRRDPLFTDVDATYEKGKPETKLILDRDKMARLGVSTAVAGMSVNALVGGADASKYRENGDDYNIRVRLDAEERSRASQLGALQVRSSSGRLVDLASFAEARASTGPSRIDRQDRLRQISVRASLGAGVALGTGAKVVEKATTLRPHPGILAASGGMSTKMNESFSSMFTALFIGIFVIYMILASQFNSYIHPFTIMFSLPLALPGAFGALLLTGEPLSIFTMIGLIMLMGLVTKNAILLVDYTNTLRTRDGLEKTEALLKAGPTRLRPILMTTASMVFGMLPIAISQGYGAETRAGMAIVVIGGLIVSTLLTLVVVPVMYSLFDGIGKKRRHHEVAETP